MKSSKSFKIFQNIFTQLDPRERLFIISNYLAGPARKKVYNLQILSKSNSQILSKLSYHEEDGIFTDRRNYHITEFYKAIKEVVYEESYNNVNFNENLEKDARFIKALNDKMTNALALLNKNYRNGVYVSNKFIGPKPVTMEMFNLDITHEHSILYDYTVTCLLYTSPSPRDS